MKDTPVSDERLYDCLQSFKTKPQLIRVKQEIKARSGYCSSKFYEMKPGEEKEEDKRYFFINSSELQCWTQFKFVNTTFDIAIAFFDGDHHQFKGNFIDSIGSIKLQIPYKKNLTGLRIRKSGMATGFTTGTITYFNVDHQFMFAEPGFCSGGDSGSLVIDNDNFVVGIVQGATIDENGNPTKSKIVSINYFRDLLGDYINYSETTDEIIALLQKNKKIK